MRLFFLLALLCSAPAYALPEPGFAFSYVPNEGADGVSCVHERIRDLPDWKVVCVVAGDKKEFTAHVIFREIPGSKSSALELLYWVTAAGARPEGPKDYHSTSAIFHFDRPTRVNTFSLGQGVENDYASLVLDADFTPKSTR
jgi:hypothetical protein